MYNTEDFYVFQHLNRPTKIMGLETDEFYPALTIGVISFIVLSSAVVSIGLFIVWSMGLKFLKRGQGRGYLKTVMYWYLPYSLGRYLFPKSPNSDYKIYRY